jgi:hypothetical protein
MPPLRPGRLTRMANRLGLRRQELLGAILATIAGAPIAACVVLLATVPVPQVPGEPFAPVAPPTIAPTETPATAPSPAPVLTAPRTAPRVVVRPEPVRPSRTASGPATVPPRAEAATETAAEPTPSPEPSSSVPAQDTPTVEPSSTATP